MMKKRNRVPHGLACALAVLTISAEAQAQRSLGLDISAWQGNWTTTQWATIKRSPTQSVGGVFGDGRDFVFIRSSRGGTTGFYNQNDPNNTANLNTLSQRYDDPYFAQNITRATTAGLFAGAYHFSRPDVIATTTNSGGIANSGADEADHFIQMAGPWMRPGYMMPVHDFEAGDGIRTDAAMAQFALDFSDRINSVMGIRPAIYINGNYAANVIGGATASVRQQVVQSHPILWTARWPNQANPGAIDVQGTQPNSSLSTLYGPWDDYGDPQPWKFWQYASTGQLNAYSGNLDLDVANGGMEYLKDQLVPALLWTDASTNWSTTTAWNSGQAPVAPVQGPGQVARVGTLVLPGVRLPASNDTVILDRGAANPTITLDSGAHTIRKLIVREALVFSGGSLNVNYVPSADSTPNSVQISSAFTLSGSASLSAHTVQVDAARTWTLTGGSLSFSKISLMPDATSPGKITLAGNVSITPLNNASATIVKGTGSGLTSYVDLGTQQRRITLTDGTAAIDLSIDVPMRNGGLAKSGAGTLRLNAANNYSGLTSVEQGTLILQMSALAHLPVLGGGASSPGGADLRGGTLVFDYAGSTSPAAQVNAILDASFDVGFASGLLHSASLPTPGHAIGWIDDGARNVTVVRTLYGDANCDLTVNFDDLLVLAQNYDSTGNWAAGDFNYDAAVNFDDLLLLAQQYELNASMDDSTPNSAQFATDWALARSIVPEPTVMMVLPAAGLLIRRRRSR